MLRIASRSPNSLFVRHRLSPNAATASLFHVNRRLQKASFSHSAHPNSIIQEFRNRWKQNVEEAPEIKESLDELKEKTEELAETTPVRTLRDAKVMERLSAAMDERAKAAAEARREKAKAARLYQEEQLKREKEGRTLTAQIKQQKEAITDWFSSTMQSLNFMDRVHRIRRYNARRRRRRATFANIEDPTSFVLRPFAQRPAGIWLTRMEQFEHDFYDQPSWKQGLYLQILASPSFRATAEFRLRQIEAYVAQQSGVEVSSSADVPFDLAEMFAGYYGHQAEPAQPQKIEESADDFAANDVFETPQHVEDLGDQAALVPIGNVVDHEPSPGSNTGAQIVVAPKNWFERQWQNLTDAARSSAIMQSFTGFQQRVEDSDSELVQRSLEVGGEAKDFVARLRSDFIPETETAHAIRQIRTRDPEFDVEEFTEMLRDDFIPRFLKANVNGDLEALKPMCGESQYRHILTAVKARKKAGYRYISNIMDIRPPELVEAVLDGQDPKLIYMFIVNQTQCVINAKNDIVEGVEDEIFATHYRVVLNMEDQPSLSKHNTTGWKIGQLQIAGMFPMW